MSLSGAQELTAQTKQTSRQEPPHPYPRNGVAFGKLSGRAAGGRRGVLESSCGRPLVVGMPFRFDHEDETEIRATERDEKPDKPVRLKFKRKHATLTNYPNGRSGGGAGARRGQKASAKAKKKITRWKHAWKPCQKPKRTKKRRRRQTNRLVSLAPPPQFSTALVLVFLFLFFHGATRPLVGAEDACRSKGDKIPQSVAQCRTAHVEWPGRREETQVASLSLSDRYRGQL
ncbi:hypothetical protein LY78DRAFT_221133 [Colletotrichum sublineola]|nr:hypothetical protein LY78DRAFT_221133 [Colletotrichum sublineola]